MPLSKIADHGRKVKSTKKKTGRISNARRQSDVRRHCGKIVSESIGMMFQSIIDTLCINISTKERSDFSIALYDIIVCLINGKGEWLQNGDLKTDARSRNYYAKISHISRVHFIKTSKIIELCMQKDKEIIRSVIPYCRRSNRATRYVLIPTGYLSEIIEALHLDNRLSIANKKNPVFLIDNGEYNRRDHRKYILRKHKYFTALWSNKSAAESIITRYLREIVEPETYSEYVPRIEHVMKNLDDYLPGLTYHERRSYISVLRSIADDPSYHLEYAEDREDNAGRLYQRDKSGIMSLPRELRELIYQDCWNGDFKSCYLYLTAYSYNMPILRSILGNDIDVRDYTYALISDIHKDARLQVKLGFIIPIFGGKKRIMREKMNLLTDEQFKEFYNLPVSREIRTEMARVFKELDATGSIALPNGKVVELGKESGGKAGGKAGGKEIRSQTLISFWTQAIEHIIISAGYEYAYSVANDPIGMRIFIHMHDGFKVRFKGGTYIEQKEHMDRMTLYMEKKASELGFPIPFVTQYNPRSQ